MPTDEEIRQKIRELCAKVQLAESPDQFQEALMQLRITLRDSIENTENLGIHLILKSAKAKSRAVAASKGQAKE